MTVGATLLSKSARMNTTSPFSFLESLGSRFQPPAWVVEEGQQKMVLFLNHVLMQEKEAQDRLLRQKGRTIHAQLGLFAIDLAITPAGLLERISPAAKPDLMLVVATESPMAVVQSALSGKATVEPLAGSGNLRIELLGDQGLAPVLDAMTEAGLLVDDCTHELSAIETAFLRMTGGTE